MKKKPTVVDQTINCYSADCANHDNISAYSQYENMLNMKKKPVVVDQTINCYSADCANHDSISAIQTYYDPQTMNLVKALLENYQF